VTTETGNEIIGIVRIEENGNHAVGADHGHVLGAGNVKSVVMIEWQKKTRRKCMTPLRLDI
jgi:hypothetical protein